MADLFRSAFSYIQQAAPIRQAGSNGLGASHPLVGTTVDVGGIKVKLRSLLAEGGFGLVFSAEDSQGNLYALKRLLAADKEAADAAIREIKFQKELSGPASIVRFVSAATRNPEQTSHGRAEFLLLTELCAGGPLIDMMQKGPISPENIFKIFYATSSAVKHMHDRNTPVTHRDIKIENLLFTSDGFIKLCDFGSATIEIWRPDDDWNALKRSLLEEEMQKHTTPMYRAPEILDTYQNYPIGPSQDIWALGCILFYLCYRTHPFEDSAKLRIINAKYVLPEEKTAYSGFHPIIKSLLQPNPHSRPSIQELCNQLEQLAYHLKIDLGKPVKDVEFERQPSPATTPSQQQPYQRSSPPLGGGGARRTPTENISSGTQQSQAAGAGEMFAQLKGQGLSIFKNIRDKSAAVVQTVQTTYGSKGPDVTWITSRLVMAPMNENVPETIAQLSEEQMKNYIIDSSGKRPFVVFNLSERQLRCDYNRCASEMPLPPVSSGVAPSLDFIIGLCKNAATFLKRDQKSMIYFTGSEAQCCLAVASLLIFCQHCDQAKVAVEAIRELRKSSSFYFPASYLRLCEVLATIVSCGNPDELRIMCHNAPVKVDCIYMEPIPLFNNAKTGCRPFAEIYCGGQMLWSGFKSYEELKVYEIKDKSISLDLGGWPVTEDVQIIVYHARWSSIQKKLQKVLIFGCGFHSNFIDGHTDHISFGRDEIDTSVECQDGISPNFKVLISLSVDPDDRGFRPQQLPEFLTYRREQIKKEWLIGCEDDELRLRQTISLVSSRPTRPPPPRPPPPGGVADGRSVPLIAPGSSKSSSHNLNLDNPFESAGSAAPKQEGFADFFSTLDWSSGQQQQQQQYSQQQNFEEIIPPSRPEPPKHQQYKKEETAVDWERKAGIRVRDEEEDEDADLYKFDYEKKSSKVPEVARPPPPPADDTEKLIDDLDELLDFAGNSKPSRPSMAPQPPTLPPHGTNNFFDDIFSTSTANSMHRNVSAPTFPNGTTSKHTKSDDPFADMGLFKPTPKSEHGSGRSTPHNPAAGLPPMDQRSRPKPPASTANKGSGDVFADLLADHGITEKKKATMGEMIRTEENKFLDPVSIKIRNWTQNKNGNIRALLSSLDEVLWPEAGNWNVPSITDMLNDSTVKKVYHRACILVHPDKQVGQPHHSLAQAIFTELNTAMKAFEEDRR